MLQVLPSLQNIRLLLLVSCFLARMESDCWTAPAPSWSKMEVERQKPKERWVEVENFPTAAQKAFGPRTPKDQEKCSGLLHGSHVNLNIQLSDANLDTEQKRLYNGNFKMTFNEWESRIFQRSPPAWKCCASGWESILNLRRVPRGVWVYRCRRLCKGSKSEVLGGYRHPEAAGPANNIKD